MPRKAPEMENPATKTFERRVALGGGAGYTTRRPGTGGTVVETQEVAAFGELIVVDPIEQMRLECLGALGPVGCTRESLEAEAAARVAAYRGARATVSGIV
jgi:hypothetical protein